MTSTGEAQPPMPSSRPPPETPTPFPGTIRVTKPMFYATGLLGCLMFVSLFAGLFLGGRGVWMFVWPVLGVFIGAPIFAAYSSIQRRAALRRLQPYAGKMCLFCHYPLHTLEPSGDCPECGTAYRHDAVVRAWERYYSLGRRFSRQGENVVAQANRAADEGAKPQGLPVARLAKEWTAMGLRSALAEVESTARSNGYAGARLARFAGELNQAQGRLHRAFPSDLYGFLGWIDPELWAALVSPSRSDAASAAVAPIESESTDEGASLTQFFAQAHVEHIRLLSPSELTYVAIEPEQQRPSPADPGSTPAAVGRPVGWVDAQPIQFGVGSAGQRIVYCLGVGRFPAGSIMMLPSDGVEPVWLADSLPQWLARLAILGGVEPAIDPSRAERAPRELLDRYLDEFRRKNPASTVLSSLQASAPSFPPPSA